MALAHALLASLLVDGACSGYDLVKRFDESISCYWMASHQQIYKELRDLEKQGWVSSETIAQTGRPNKNLYSITALGQEHLAHWILTPSVPTVIREDLMIKTLAGFLVPNLAMLDELKRRRQIHLDKLAVLKEIERQEFPQVAALSREQKFCYLSIRRGIRYEADWVAWCEEAIALLAEE
ncbi:MAG: PadR family transcriptional regulator [Oscillatoriophycideae cyanobacterium NC_groundwater_1537_Pr4_S-0.65um_50_18]|nr:PadR family transcriptional regulator [Oscillatoriophycideae cyanobacterium NC_groundwater_1537_Pr4_S-0.65um_50_18]